MNYEEEHYNYDVRMSGNKYYFINLKTRKKTGMFTTEQAAIDATWIDSGEGEFDVPKVMDIEEKQIRAKESESDMLIHFNVYYEKNNKTEVLTTFRIPLFNMNKEEAMRLRDEIVKNPFVGTVTILLNNGMHI